MSIKGILGFCECKGCWNRAKSCIVIKNIKTNTFKKLIVCNDCLFDF